MSRNMSGAFISFLSLIGAVFITSIIASLFADTSNTQFASAFDSLARHLKSLGIILTVIFVCGIGLLLFFLYKQEKKAVREKLEYQNGLVFQLKKLLTKIESHTQNPILITYKEIANEIINLENGKRSSENIKYLEEQAFHEINVLKEINKLLENNLKVTNDTVIRGIKRVNRGLKYHYNEFNKSQTIGLQEEIYILDKVNLSKSKEIEYFSSRQNNMTKNPSYFDGPLNIDPNIVASSAYNERCNNTSSNDSDSSSSSSCD